MNKPLYFIANFFMPRFLFNAFLSYRNTFEKFLNRPDHWEKILESDENKIFFLKQLIKTNSGSSHHLPTTALESIQIIQPEEYQIYSPKVYRELVKKSYGSRNFIQFEYFLSQIGEFDPNFEKFYRLTSRQYLHSDVSVQEWEELATLVEPSDPRLYNRIAGQLAVKHLHQQNVDQAVHYFQKRIQYGKMEGNIHIAIGILKLYIKQAKSDQAKQFYVSLIDSVKNKREKDLLILKFYEVAVELDLIQKNRDQKVWKQLFSAVRSTKMDSANLEFFQDLERMFLELEKIRPVLLDLRISSSEQQHLTGIIFQKLKDKQPFSLIRLGDGESYGLTSDAVSDKQILHDQTVREMKWWGENLPKHLKEKIIAMFLEATECSDVVGIPSVFRFVRAAENLYAPMMEKTDIRGSWMVMEYIIKAVNQGKFQQTEFVEHRCHQVLFRKEDIDSFISKASKTIVVSQYSQEQLDEAFGSGKVEAVLVPAERKKYGSLPYRVDEIALHLKTKIVPGALVLVASGFAGKYFLKVGKDAGAVALDVGAMADYWVGKNTRQVADLV